MSNAARISLPTSSRGGRAGSFCFTRMPMRTHATTVAGTAFIAVTQTAHANSLISPTDSSGVAICLSARFASVYPSDEITPSTMPVRSAD